MQIAVRIKQAIGESWMYHVKIFQNLIKSDTFNDDGGDTDG